VTFRGLIRSVMLPSLVAIPSSFADNEFRELEVKSDMIELTID
jgi:hypothetical protein